MLNLKEYNRLANAFGQGKDQSLVYEAGGKAIYLLAVNCHLRYGKTWWIMEANKIWRTCVKKKARARRRNLLRRGGLASGTYLSGELCKCARRLVPEKFGRVTVVLPKFSAEEPGWGSVAQTFQACRVGFQKVLPPGLSLAPQKVLPPNWLSQRDHQEIESESVLSHLEWHKISEPSETSQIDSAPELRELQGELRRLKKQLSKQAQRANAHEAEIRKLRESKYQLLKMTSNQEACKIQTLWRSSIAQSDCFTTLGQEADKPASRLCGGAATIIQAMWRCVRTRRRFQAVIENRALRAARTLQSLGQRRAHRCAMQQFAAVRVQALLRCAAQTRVRRLKRARANIIRLKTALAASDTTIINLHESLNSLHALHSITTCQLNVNEGDR
mmetsp:Transcript_36580/g.113178  ORF Transcript_36580/g.113178 Transcript_36580/m.113178 type:complete len:387 (-) Transcript_36580:195-1355(-)